MRELARFELLHLIDVLAFSSDVGYCKPHCGIFEGVLEELEVEANEAVFVGDSPIDDIEGAQAIGMRAVLKSHPFQAACPNGIHPDAVVHSLADLTRVIAEWEPSWSVH